MENWKRQLENKKAECQKLQLQKDEIKKKIEELHIIRQNNKGSSDFVLLQYYMRTVYGWTDERTQNIRLDSIKRSRTLKKDENLLTIR